MDEVDYTDWIAERAGCLLNLAINLSEVEDQKAKDMIYRMMNKLVDSVVLPKEATITKLGKIINNE